MHLNELKEDIDAGKTAKLFHPMNRPGGIEITVRSKKAKHEGVDCSIWQHFTEGTRLDDYRNPQTDLYPRWEQLLEAIKGDQTETYNLATLP
jgi:hypothetical protein